MTTSNTNGIPDMSGATSIYTFTADSSTSPFQVPFSRHLKVLDSSHDHQSSTRPIISHIAIGALTFHPSPSTSSSPQKILLLQRASTDSMPNKWEIPGGACDDEDESILHSVARELHEEAGVVARSIGPVIELSDTNGYVFPVRSGKLVRKYNFLVELAIMKTEKEVAVRLDKNEHQNSVWATEEDCRAGKCGDVSLEFTSPEQLEVILNAFKVRMNLREEQNLGLGQVE